MQRMKRCLGLLLALALVFSLLSVSAGAAELADYEPAGSMTELYAAVSGGAAAPTEGAYSIGSAEELKLLADLVAAGNGGAGLTFYLTADVDLGGEAAPWAPIGVFDTQYENHLPFAGVFDGCGHAVTGLYVGGDDYTRGDGARNEANGLFGLNAGTIRNLAVEGSVNTYRCGALIAGHNEGTISCCLVSGSVSANGGGGTRGSGGVAGENSGLVEDCISRATIYNAYRRAGGVVGYNYQGTVKNSFFTGSASSKNSGYSGGVAATNEDATVENCWWLEGSSADNCAYYQYENKEYVTAGSFTAEGLLSGTDTPLLDVLTGDSFKAPAAGGLPLLFWDEDDAETYTVTVTQPAAGGRVTAACGDAVIEGSASLEAGASLTLTASPAEENYFFRGFEVNDAALKGTATENGFTATCTVAGDTAITAVYVSLDDVALTLAAQAGEYGDVTPVKAYSYNELFALAGEDQTPAGYMYTHGTDGWNVVGATQYVPVAALIEDAGLTPAANDVIIALEGEGHSAILPTWELLQSGLYFFPNASGEGAELSFPTEGKVPVPAAMALRYSTGRVGATAADRLAQAAENAAFTGSLRFVFGSSEEDYVDLKNENGTVTGNRLWGNVDTLVVRSASQADSITVSVFGEDHSLAELKQYETEAAFTVVKRGEETEVPVKGIRLSDLITKVAGLDEAAFASVTFTAGDGFTATVNQSEYGWDKVMLIWEGNGASEEALQSAVDGGAGKLWNKGVVSVTGEAAALTVNGTVFTRSMLAAAQDLDSAVWTVVKKGETVETTVSGVTLAALTAAYPGLNGEAVVGVIFKSADGFTTPIYTVDAENGLDAAAVLWLQDGEEVFKSGVNGAAGKSWANDLAEVTLQYGVSFTFTVSPANAALTVTDAAGSAVAPREDGSYALIAGETYTYLVTAPGCTGRSDSFVPSAELTALTVTLNPQGGGVQPPAEDVLFTVYTQEGENGAKKLAKAFTLSEIRGNLQSGVFPYLFYRNGGWAAIVATKVLPIETLVAEAGASAEWKSGSYLNFVCNDGPYPKSHPSYDDIRTAAYSFDADGTATVVPAGIAIEWESGIVGNGGALEELTAENYAAIAAQARDTGSYRLVFGTTEALFSSANAGGDAPAGARMPTGVIEMIIVYDAPEVPGGTVGTVHTPEENPKAEDPEPLVFTDVAEDAWYKEAVDFASARGLFNGIAEGVFAPEMPMNRAMVVTVLYRMSGEKAGAAAPFADVESGSWYAEAVAWAAEKGITKGTGTGFAPYSPVTREQLVTFLHRYAVYKGVDVSVGEDTNILSYDDAFDVAGWAVPAMQWACGAGILEGRTASTLAPKDEAIRAEVAAILMRFVRLTEK